MPKSHDKRGAATPTVEVLAPENLPFQMHLLVQGMTRRMQRLLDPYRLTPLHWGVLCCLWRKEGITPKNIAQQLSQLGGTITVALQAMERRKLIRRQVKPEDRRGVQIFLTSQGRGLQATLVPAAANLIEELFKTLDSSERSALHATVQKLRLAVDASE